MEERLQILWAAVVYVCDVSGLYKERGLMKMRQLLNSTG